MTIGVPEWQIYYESFGWWTVGYALPIEGIFLTYRFMSDDDYSWHYWEKAIREGTPQRITWGGADQTLLYIENGESFYRPQKQEQYTSETRSKRWRSKHFKRCSHS